MSLVLFGQDGKLTRFVEGGVFVLIGTEGQKYEQLFLSDDQMAALCDKWLQQQTTLPLDQPVPYQVV